MAKYFAIPLRDNGTEQLGTFGVFVGHYKSVDTFIRYNVSKNAKEGTTYNLYLKGTDWHLICSYRKD